MSETKKVEFEDGSTATVLRDDEGITIIDCDLRQSKVAIVVDALEATDTYNQPKVYEATGRTSSEVYVAQENITGAGTFVDALTDDERVSLEYVKPFRRLHASHLKEVDSNTELPNFNDCAPVFGVEVNRE